MSKTSVPRRLATIVALDVAGYSAKTETDEAKTTAEVAALRAVIETIAVAHGGRVFNTAGDGFMLEFSSSLAAVEAAQDLAAKCEPKVRVGVHLGDVVVQPSGDLLGHGVNVAARLMAKSEPGEALVSADVRRTVRGPLGERLVSRGLMQLDKMNEMIEAFAIAEALDVKATASTRASVPFLAVLPFDNLSDDRDMQFFSDGVAEEILHNIAGADGLKVAGRESSFQFRGTDKSARRVGRELGATHVLDGSVRRSGKRVRVSVHLVETATQATIWRDRFDRDLSDILHLQDEIALAIAQSLEVSLSVRNASPQIEPAAYDLFLKARAKYAGNWTEDEFRHAIDMLEQCVAMAPAFARAWGMLAWLKVHFLPRDRDLAFVPEAQGARVAANRALAIDPDCAEGYAALSAFQPAFGGWSEKLRLTKRAAELAPSDAFVLGWHARSWSCVGRIGDCITAFERCAELEPDKPIFRAGVAFWYLCAGRVAEGDAIAQSLFEKHRESAVIWLIRMLAYWMSERRLALDMLKPGAVLPQGIDRARADYMRARFRLYEAPKDERRKSVRDMLSGPNPTVQDCVIAADAGETDLAFSQLFRALDAGALAAEPSQFGGLRSTMFEAPFLLHGKGFRRDLRFPRVCAHVGLVEFWRNNSIWPDCAEEVPYDFRAECEKAMLD